jgi:hypothetical protein
MTRRLLPLLITAVLAVVAGCGGAEQSSAPLRELQRTRAGNLDVVMLSDRDALSQGKGSFVLEFRSRDGQLVDVGNVKVNATMPMAGMAPMIGTVAVEQGGVAGRYRVASDFSMAGSWRIGVDWDGPAGRESATLPGRVR